MNKLKSFVDISYNLLLENGDISQNKEKTTNKTMENAGKSSKFLKNSTNQSYLSTPMILMNSMENIKKKQNKWKYIKNPKEELKLVLKPINSSRKSLKTGNSRKNVKNSNKVSIKTPKYAINRESKKSIRLSTARKEANNDITDEPTPKMSIRTRASSENNPEKMIRNVRSDIEQLKNKIKGRLARLSIKNNGKI